MSTSANKRDRSSLPSVEAWENEGGALAPQRAKETASPRKSSAFRGQDERKPQNTGSNHAASDAHTRRRQRPRHLRCMLEGERDGIEERGLVAGISGYTGNASNRTQDVAITRQHDVVSMIGNFMNTKPEHCDRPIYVTQQFTSKPTSIRNVIAWTFIYIGIFVLGMEAVDKVSFGGVGPGLGIAMIGLIWLAAPFRETYFPDRGNPP
jgi:hypothetical protein